MQTSRWLLVSWIALWGCEAPAPPTPAPAPPRFEPSDGRVQAAEPDAGQAVRWRGDGAVKVGELEVLGEERGLLVERQRWRYEGIQGWAWRVSVPLPGAATVAATSEVVPLEQVVHPPASGPWAAINGGFYEERSGKMAPMGVVLSAGKVAQRYQRRGGSGVFAVVDDAPQIVHRDRWSELSARRPAHALQSIDRIISAGASLVKPREGAGLAARSAVVVGDQRLWLVALAADGSITERADGAIQLRATGWQGLPLWGFAQYLLATTDAREALNLDGAVSTQLIAQASGKTWRVLGERGTMNAIVLAP
jgi:hypothetical protein